MLSDTFIFIRIIERDIVINVDTPSCTVRVILIRFHKNPSSGNGDGLKERQNRRTHKMELIVAFHNLGKASKINKKINHFV